MIKDKYFKQGEEIVKVKIKDGITEIDGREVTNGYIEFSLSDALYKITHKPFFYLEIIKEPVKEKIEKKIEKKPLEEKKDEDKPFNEPLEELAVKKIKLGGKKWQQPL